MGMKSNAVTSDLGTTDQLLAHGQQGREEQRTYAATCGMQDHEGVSGPASDLLFVTKSRYASNRGGWFVGPLDDAPWTGQANPRGFAEVQGDVGGPPQVTQDDYTQLHTEPAASWTFSDGGIMTFGGGNVGRSLQEDCLDDDEGNEISF